MIKTIDDLKEKVLALTAECEDTPFGLIIFAYDKPDFKNNTRTSWSSGVNVADKDMDAIPKIMEDIRTERRGKVDRYKNPHSPNNQTIN